METEDGCRLWTSLAGRGEPLITCHGGPGLWDMFGDVVPMIDDLARVLRWDQRGCGRSTRRGPYSMARTVGDLDAVRTHHFDSAEEKVALLGHSWGAQLALRYTLEHPDRVSRLIYVSGTGLGRAWHPDYQRNLAARLGPAAARLKNRSRGEERELALLQWSADFADRGREFAERMATPWLGINYACNTAINADDKLTWREEELLPACRDLAVPVLIIDGAHDIRPRWGVDSLAGALPSVTRVTLPDAGHVPWFESPGEFRAALRDFLS